MFMFRPNRNWDSTQTKTTLKFSPNTNQPRQVWDSDIKCFAFFLAYCTGFGNIWRFPYLCAEHSIAFLIPYIIIALLVGLPMLILEMVLGQYLKRGPVYAYKEIAPIGKGIGWSNVFITFTCSIYYNLIIAWILQYEWKSITVGSKSLPWNTCDDIDKLDCFTLPGINKCMAEGLAYWNNSCIPKKLHCKQLNLEMHNITHCKDPFKQNTFVDFEENGTFASDHFFRKFILGQTDPKNPMKAGEFGSILLCPMLFYIIAWAIVFVCLLGSIQTTGKIVYFTLILPYAVLFFLLIQETYVPKTWESFLYVLEFSFDKLQNKTIWMDASTQVLFTLGVGFGCLPTIASYNDLHHNIMRDAFLLVFYNMMTSILCTMLMYSTIYEVSSSMAKHIREIYRKDIGLPFKIYSQAVAENKFLASVFFFMLFTMGIDTQLVMVQTMVSTIKDLNMKIFPHRVAIVLSICIFCCLIGILSFGMEGSEFIFQQYEKITGSFSLFVIVFFQVIVVSWLYGFSRATEENGIFSTVGIKNKAIQLYLKITLVYLTPLSLLILLGLSLYEIVTEPTDMYPYLDYFIVALSFIIVICGAIHAIIKHKGKSSLFSPTSNFKPEHIRKAQEIKLNKTKPMYEITPIQTCLPSTDFSDFRKRNHTRVVHDVQVEIELHTIRTNTNEFTYDNAGFVGDIGGQGHVPVVSKTSISASNQIGDTELVSNVNITSLNKIE